MNIKLTWTQVETMEYLLYQAKKNVKKDFPNDPDIQKNWIKKYETIQKNFNKAMILGGFRDPKATIDD